MLRENIRIFLYMFMHTLDMSNIKIIVREKENYIVKQH